jgi:hypothetical protein
LKPGNYTFIRISIISVSQHSMAGNIQRNHFPRVQSLFMSTKNVCIYGYFVIASEIYTSYIVL